MGKKCRDVLKHCGVANEAEVVVPYLVLSASRTLSMHLSPFLLVDACIGSEEKESLYSLI